MITTMIRGMVGAVVASATGSVPAYEDEASALFARFTSDPGTTRRADINVLVAALKSAGVWGKLDALYVIAAHNEQAAQRNWIADAYNLAPQSSPAFTSDRGYQSNGSTSYISTGFNPANAPGKKYVLNDAFMGVWIQAAATASNSSEIGITNARIYSRTGTDGTVITRANDSTQTTTVSGSPAVTGLLSWSRLASGSYTAYRGDTSVAAPSVASTSITNATLDILRSGGVYSNSVVGAAFVGAGLSASEVTALNSALNTYMTAVGAA